LMLVGSALKREKGVTPFPGIERETDDPLVESRETGDWLTEGSGWLGIGVTGLGY